jgi:hypothetical protein
MSGTSTGPWLLLADMVRQGVDNFVTTQKTLLDIAVQQNAMWMGAVKETLGQASHPAMADLAGKGTQAFLESQKMMLDLASQQNQMALNLVKTTLGGAGRPFLNELADMMAQGAQTFVEAQKRLLEFAAQQAEAMTKAAKDTPGPGAGNPLAYLAEFSKQGVEAFVEAQKRFLDLIAQETASATDRLRQRQGTVGESGQPGSDAINDILAQARKSFQAYVDLQRQFAESANRWMTEWNRAWQSGTSFRPAQNLQDLARQGVDAFLTTQRVLLDLTLRSMYPDGTKR